MVRSGTERDTVYHTSYPDHNPPPSVGNAMTKLLLLSLVASAAAIKMQAETVPRRIAPKFPVSENMLSLRGGGALGTPLSPLELGEAVMGVVYWIQIALLPQVWAKNNMGVEMDSVASTVTTLAGALLFGLRACTLLLRAKAPELKKETDLVSTITWAYCCATLFIPGNAFGPGFVPNLVICGFFAAAYGLRYLGVF